jgi:hypothetical protein
MYFKYHVGKKRMAKSMFEWIFNTVNNDCPNYNFPLPITEIMVDTTICHESLTFRHDSYGYNQIQIAPEDEEKIVFQSKKNLK